MGLLSTIAENVTFGEERYLAKEATSEKMMPMATGVVVGKRDG